MSLFRKFSTKDNVSSQAQVKSSVQRGIRSSILEQYPSLEEHIEDILPKKGSLILMKCKDHVNIVSMNSRLLFFQERDGPYYPHLKLLHCYPDMMPRVQADKGAIKFILSGAHLMCPGLTSKGGKIDGDMPAKTLVAVYTENHEHAIAVGCLELSSEEIVAINKGIGVTNVHQLNDGLWKAKAE